LVGELIWDLNLYFDWDQLCDDVRHLVCDDFRYLSDDFIRNFVGVLVRNLNLDFVSHFRLDFVWFLIRYFAGNLHFNFVGFLNEVSDGNFVGNLLGDSDRDIDFVFIWFINIRSLVVEFVFMSIVCLLYWYGSVGGRPLYSVVCSFLLSVLGFIGYHRHSSVACLPNSIVFCFIDGVVSGLSHSLVLGLNIGCVQGFVLGSVLGYWFISVGDFVLVCVPGLLVRLIFGPNLSFVMSLKLGPVPFLFLLSVPDVVDGLVLGHWHVFKMFLLNGVPDPPWHLPVFGLADSAVFDSILDRISDFWCILVEGVYIYRMFFSWNLSGSLLVLSPVLDVILCFIGGDWHFFDGPRGIDVSMSMFGRNVSNPLRIVFKSGVRRL